MPATPVQLTLRPEQAAVVAALQRISAGMRMESAQLAQIYGQEATAELIVQHLRQLDEAGQRYIEDCQRAIVIAHEMPNGVSHGGDRG